MCAVAHGGVAPKLFWGGTVLRPHFLAERDCCVKRDSLRFFEAMRAVAFAGVAPHYFGAAPYFVRIVKQFFRCFQMR